MLRTRILGLMFLLAAAAARGSVVEQVTLERALLLSTDVVIGVVSDRRPWRDDGGAIHTDYAVRVEEVLGGGSTAGDVLTVRQLGGRIGPDFMLVAGMPEFAVGERVLLFLTTARDGTRRTLGLFLGAYTIVLEGGVAQAVQEPAGGAHLVGSPDPAAMLPTRTALDELLRRLRAATGAR